MSTNGPTRALRRRRQSGAMFTVMVLVTATILLAVGGALVDANRNLTRHAGLADQQEQAKEALAGATEWARGEVASWGGATKSTRVLLDLARARVAVKLDAVPDGVALDAVATVKPDVEVGATALLVRKGERWVVTSFSFVQRAR